MDDKNKNVITEDKCLEITYILPDFWCLSTALSV